MTTARTSSSSSSRPALHPRRAWVAAFSAWLAIATLLAGGEPGLSARAAQAPTARYDVVRVYPHDPEAFTQGLAIVDGVMYESTGLNGRSTVRKVKIENGEVLQVRTVPEQYFGEGIAVWKDRIFSLTWQSGVGFIYDRQSFEKIGMFRYSGEGWGLTHDGRRLIMSDGTAWLRFLDPDTQRETGRVQVLDGRTPIDRLNELEFVNGEVLANVWTTDRVVRIDPKTGRVLGWIDFAGLLSPRDAAGGADVMNGIAYDAVKNRLFVTGKLWPRLFEVKIRH